MQDHQDSYLFNLNNHLDHLLKISIVPHNSSLLNKVLLNKALLPTFNNNLRNNFNSVLHLDFSLQAINKVLHRDLHKDLHLISKVFDLKALLLLECSSLHHQDLTLTI